jgi:GNAT superfamily N-acetyltransferase
MSGPGRTGSTADPSFPRDGRGQDIHPLDADHADAVVSVLAEAFAGYPVMRYVLGGEGAPERLTTLVRLFTMARVLRGEPMLGVWRDDTLAAAAIASDLHGPPSPDAFRTLRTAIWRALGTEAEARYDRYGEAARTFAIEAPHVHLNMIGVRCAFQRQGLGRALIHAVQDVSRARPGSTGVSLTTEDPANVPYYLALGFDLMGHAEVVPGVETWGFFRANGPR